MKKMTALMCVLIIACMIGCASDNTVGPNSINKTGPQPIPTSLVRAEYAQGFCHWNDHITDFTAVDKQADKTFPEANYYYIFQDGLASEYDGFIRIVHFNKSGSYWDYTIYLKSGDCVNPAFKLTPVVDPIN